MKAVVKMVIAMLFICSVAKVSYADLKVIKEGEGKTGNGIKADPFNLSSELSFGFKFNTLRITDNKGNQTVTANRGTDATTANPPMIYGTYCFDGENISFNGFLSAGLAGGAKEGDNTLGDTTVFAIDYGADLNYIIMNKDKLYLSVGLCENSYLGGITMNQTSRKSGNTIFVNTLGIDARSKFYAFKELYFTGYLSFSFLSLYSNHYYGVSVGNPAPDYSMGTYDAQSPFLFSFNVTVSYRPAPEFAITGGLGYTVLTFKSSYTDKNNANYNNPSYTFSNFMPKVGISLLW